MGSAKIEDRRKSVYRSKRERLTAKQRHALDLIEEAIYADPAGTSFRRQRPDGTWVDLSGWDEWGILVNYRIAEDGKPDFLDLATA